MRPIINLTQHSATDTQVEAGVRDLNHSAKVHLRELLTFDSIPSRDEIQFRAEEIALIACAASYEVDGMECPYREAMIGGAPFLMGALEVELKKLGIRPLYAFSKREVVEETIGDETRKVAVFRHLGFVEGS